MPRSLSLSKTPSARQATAGFLAPIERKSREMLLPNVLPYGLYAVSGMRAKCSGGIKYLFAYVGRSVSVVGNKNLFLGKSSVALSYWKYSHQASLAALVLLCVPSMKTALGNRYPVSATSSSSVLRSRQSFGTMLSASTISTIPRSSFPRSSIFHQPVHFTS